MLRDNRFEGVHGVGVRKGEHFAVHRPGALLQRGQQVGGRNQYGNRLGHGTTVYRG
jgi:hypothetical protein